MNNSTQAIGTCAEQESLTGRLQYLLATTELSVQQNRIKQLLVELNTDVLACAAALLYLLEPPIVQATSASALTNTVKMVRYRLDIGSQHQICAETLKKVLVEESGVDKNNINNINIRGLYTLIDLPDAMPIDIFQHLKTVEINQRPLAIKRVKSRNKKRSNLHRRRSKPRYSKSDKSALESSAD